MISDNDEGETGNSENGDVKITVSAVFPAAVGLFILFIGLTLIALTIAPALATTHTTLEVYTYLVRITALWAGLAWLSASIYLSLVTGSREFSVEIWIAFLIGALMSYLGISGKFIDIPYWLGVRALTYGLISMAALALVANVQRRLDANNPSLRVVDQFRRVGRQFRRWRK